MAFNPDQYLKEKAQPSFDPDSYLKTKLGQPQQDISELESGLRGAAQGATFGFAPTITGALETAPDALESALGSKSMDDVLTAYKKARDASKANFDAAQEANPKSYLAGSLGGGLAPALLTGGASEAGSAAQGLSALSKAVPLIPSISARTAAGALTGAGYGALSGVGNATSSGKDLGDTAKEAAEGAAGGSLLGGLMSKLGSMLPSSESLDEIAGQKALKAAGLSKGQLKNLIKQDVKTNAFQTAEENPEGIDSIKKYGNLLVNKNPYQEQAVVTAGSTPEDILERAQDLASKSGQEIGNILSHLDSKGVNESFVNPSNIANEIETQLLNPLKVNGQISPASKGAATTIQNILDTVKQFGDQPISFQKANELKQLIANITNYEAEGSSSNQALRRAGGIINKSIEDSADDVAGDSDIYKNAKDLYKSSQIAINGAIGKIAGNMSNHQFGLTDYMSGIAGAAAHGTPGGAIALLGNKLAKTYGNSIAATTAKNASNVIGSVNRTLVGAPKEAISSLGQQLVSSGGDLAKSLGNVLLTASERDDVGRNALIFSLMQNPSYRQLLTKYLGNDEKK